MPTWKVKDILNHVQDLIGEPVGSFYNVSTRLTQINQAQRELVQDTRAIQDVAIIPAVVGQAEYDLPSDFLTYGREQPYYSNAISATQKLQVVDVGWLDETFPHWRDATLSANATPKYLADIGQMKFVLHVTPGDLGTIYVPYVVAPTDVETLEDEVFNGIETVNRYSLALAYKVAAVYMMPRVPQLGQQYLSMYNRELRQMRHDLRVNPQKQAKLRPTSYIQRYRGD